MKNLIQKLKVVFLATTMVAVYSNVNAQCDPPKINSFTPITGFIGSTVTISGANFDATPANNQVFFGATQATVLTASFGTLTVTAPVGATTALISVRNNCAKTAYSQVPFNGIFCPTPLTSTTYQNRAFTLSAKGAYNMHCYDMDLDGKPDVISGGVSANGITIARNTSTPGTLNFARYDISCPGPQQQAFADFDGDGRLDITFCRGSVYFIRNLSSPGSLSFSGSTYLGNYRAYQIAVGDFNNDGKIDIVAEGGNYLRFFRNNSTGPGNISFTFVRNVYVGARATGLQCADVDGDGLTDVLGTQGSRNRAFSVRSNNTSLSNTFSFEGAEYWSSRGSYPYRCQIADFDKDGKIDLTTCNYQGSTNTAVFRNTSSVGNIVFATAYTMAAPRNNYRIQVGDVNGDGLPDIVTKSLGVNVFSVYPNTSSGTGNVSFGTRIDYSSSARAEVSGIVVGDLDGDYVPDIATSGINSNTIIFHRNTSSQSDQQDPSAICKNITVALSPTGTVVVTPEMIDNGSSDACGIDFLRINGNTSVTFTCNDIGTNNVTLLVTDNAGNTDQCNAVVTVAPAAIIVAGQTTVCQGQTVTMTANTGDSYQWYKDGTAISGATSQTYIATSTGDYQVMVTNAGGCSGTSSKTAVVVNNNPTVDITPASVASLCNGSATLTASTSSLYQWRLNGSNISGATQQSYNATSTGTYSVQVIDIFGCSATSSGVVVNNNPPEIDIQGNGTSIANGDATPSAADHTDFGTVGNEVRTYTISNSGSGTLYIDAISLSGPGAGDYSIGGITLPANVAASGSTTFTVTFSRATLGDSEASINIVNNDCDEGSYSYAIFGELNCTVPDFTSCPSDIAQNTDAGECSAVVSYSTVVTGIPSPTLTYTLTGATSGSGSGNGSGSTFNLGTTTVQISASNICGADACSFDVVVSDNEKPVTKCQGATVTLSSGGATITTNDINDGSTDNCGIASYELDDYSFDCDDIGSNTVTLTVTDNSGNSSSCDATVTVVGVVPTCTVTSSPNTSGTVIGGTSTNAATNQMFLGYGPQSMNISCAASGGSSLTYSWAGSGLSNTSIANPIFTPSAAGNYTLTCTVTNNYGCVTTCSITICVIDVTSSKGSKKKPKVIVCHVPKGNPSNVQNIHISINAVPAHLGLHGGCTLGPCGGSCDDNQSYKRAVEAEMHTIIIGQDHMDLIVYPNPSANSFNFILESPNDDLVHLVVSDLNGRILIDQSGLTPNDEVTFGEDLPAGAYFATIQQGEYNKTIKIVKVANN